MININNTSWNDLSINDIIEFLHNDTDETFFFEFKSDKENTKGVIKEISAFANTYGGYILIGVEDNKEITGCKEWNEERIHNVMHNCITPIPIFDVKPFKTEDNLIVIVIKIEEGMMPPYITNNGHIYERVSSGSFPIKESAKLNQLYYKKEEQLRKIENKLKIEDINLSMIIPGNICGYLDIGFSLICSEPSEITKNIDLKPIISFLDDELQRNTYGISHLGKSFLFNIGNIEHIPKDGRIQNNQYTPLCAGIHNFMEIMFDGSVKLRTILFSDNNKSYKANVTNAILSVKYFEKIYSLMMGQDLYKNFISAYRYEKLTVLKQFIPYFKNIDGIGNGWESHELKYGRNQIIVGSRIPPNDFNIIDKRYFDAIGEEFNNQTLIQQLFISTYFTFGFIDFGKDEDDIS